MTPQDVVIALSNSGESNEILALIPVFEASARTAYLHDQPSGERLGRAADIHLCVKVPREACPLGFGANHQHNRRAGYG